jgi:uncharacterized protein (TIGR04255 family)
MTTYPKNFISKVIARVDFQPILKLKEEEPVAFQDAIRQQFPRFGQKNSVDISIKAGEVPVTTKNPIWQFTNKEKTDVIGLNYQFLSLTSDKYISFESYFANVEFMYNIFNNIYHPSIIMKIGLRFINEIKLKGNPFDWDGFINNNLYYMLNSFPELPTSLTRAMSQMHMNKGDRLITFQFGIFNSEYPNIITQREFILDYDCVSREECEPDGVLSKLKFFYEEIKKLFKQSRGDKLIKIMKGQNV